MYAISMLIFVVNDKKLHLSEKSPGKGSATLNPAGLDLNLLLEEIRQLRIQLVKTIENNNALRQKLEEQLDRSPSSSLRGSHNAQTLGSVGVGGVGKNFGIFLLS